MATLNEPFESAASGNPVSTSNTVLGNVGNTVNNSITFSTTQKISGTRGARLSTAATADTATLRLDFAATATPHVRAYFYLDRLPTSGEGTYSILVGRAAGVAVANIRVNPTGTIVVRDGTTAVPNSPSTAVVVAAAWFRIEWFINCTAGTQTMQMFVGANVNGTTPDDTVTGPFTGGATINQITGGMTASIANFGMYMDDFGYNDAAYMGPSVVSSALTANAGVDQTNKGEGNTVNLGGSATGGGGTYTYTWSQLSGTTVTLTGSGANKSFTVPQLTANETLTFQLSVNDGTTTATDTVNIGVLRQIVPNAGADQSGVATGTVVTLTSAPVGGSGGYVYTWTQLSGTTVTLSGTGSGRTFTVPTNTGETLTFRVSITDSVGSTAKQGVTNVGIVAASSAISAYTKNFNGGSNGGTAVGEFANVSGTGSAVYTNSPAIEGALSVRVASAGTAYTLRSDDTVARTLVERLVRIRFEQFPAATTAFTAWYQGTGGTQVKGGDMRISATGALSARDNNTNQGGSFTVSLNTNYWLRIKSDTNSTTGLRWTLYADNGTQLFDSGDLTYTSNTAAGIDNWRWGVISADTMTFVLDELKGDSAVQMFPPSTVIVANAGADQTGKADGTTVGLAGSATGGNGIYTYAWAQLSGPSVTLNGTGANRTFVVPSGSAATAVFELTVTDSAGATAGVDTVSVGFLASISPNAGADQADKEPFSTVTLTGSATGGNGTYTYSWNQISGALVVLAGSGATRTYTAPATAGGDTAIFRLTVSDSAGSVVRTDDVSVSTDSHTEFYNSSGTERAYIARVRQSGAWV